jgi:cardiolipin synthase
MMHAKTFLVDNSFSMVGSANFDNRSLELNDELNVVVFERAVVSRLRSDFEKDVARSRRITLEAWRARPLYEKARDKMWSLFGEVF